MEKGAAVIVTYNRKDLLLRCIEAIQAQPRKDLLDILVIDLNDLSAGRIGQRIKTLMRNLK